MIGYFIKRELSNISSNVLYNTNKETKSVLLIYIRLYYELSERN